MQFAAMAKYARMRCMVLKDQGKKHGQSVRRKLAGRFPFRSFMGISRESTVSASDKNQAKPWNQHNDNPGNKYKD